MKVTQKTGIVKAMHAGKNGFSFVLANGTRVPISELLLGVIAKGMGFSSINGLQRNVAGAVITYNEEDIKAGDRIGTNFRGEEILNTRKTNADGSPNQYFNTPFHSNDHVRYNEISIELSQKALNGLNYADAMIAAEGIVSRAAQLPVVNDYDGTSPHAPLNQPAPMIETAADLLAAAEVALNADAPMLNENAG